MHRLKKFVLATALAAGSFATAAEVDIDALGGVIPDNPSAVVNISSASGSGSEVTLAADNTRVARLVQAQSAVDPLVRLGDNQQLTLSSLSILPGMSDLQLGAASRFGLMTTSADTLMVTVSDEESILSVNANLLIGSRTLAKFGLGRVQSRGDFCGTVEQTEGTMVYSGFSGNLSALLISGDGAAYDICSAPDYRSQLNVAVQPDAPLKVDVAVVSSSGQVTIKDFVVSSGAQVKLENATLLEADVADDQSAYPTAVPECMVIGTNSLGVLRFSGSSYFGKLALGGNLGATSKAAVYLEAGSSVTDICSTNGEYLLGRSGYSYLGLSGGDFAVGGWCLGGRNGQLGVAIEYGTFRLLGDETRSSGLGLGGSESDVSLYIGSGGSLDASLASFPFHFPIKGVTDAKSVQVTVKNGGSFAFGANYLNSTGRLTLNLGNNGQVSGHGVKFAGSAMLQCDGGAWRAMGEGRLFTGDVYLQRGGLTITVDGAASVESGDGLLAPTGKGVSAIALPDDLAAMKFVGPPALRIIGNGHGATAVCRFDPDAGVVTGIEVTGRGVGYTVIEEVGVYYGDSDALVYSIDASNVTLEENACGGLIKSGGGTLVLTGNNTYTGATDVVGGTLLIAPETTLPVGSGLKVRNGAVVDLGGIDREFFDFGGDGTGSITNGTPIVKGLRVDFDRVLSGEVETLNFEGVEVAPDAVLQIDNVSDAILDRSKEYVLYNFVGEAPYRAFPIDAGTYSRMASTWAAVIKDGKMVLKNVGGSYFIYY